MEDDCWEVTNGRREVTGWRWEVGDGRRGCDWWAGPRKIMSVSGPQKFGPPFSGDKKASSDQKV